MKAICGGCGGAGRVKTGEPLGTADGPQYGECSTCHGTGRVVVDMDVGGYACFPITEYKDGEANGKMLGDMEVPGVGTVKVYKSEKGIFVMTPTKILGASFDTLALALASA